MKQKVPIAGWKTCPGYGKILFKGFCEFLGFTERSAEGWLDILGPFLGIYEHLDDRVIGESYGRVEVLYILKQVFEMSKTSDGPRTKKVSNLPIVKKRRSLLTSGFGASRREELKG